MRQQTEDTSSRERRKTKQQTIQNMQRANCDATTSDDDSDEDQEPCAEPS